MHAYLRLNQKRFAYIHTIPHHTTAYTITVNKGNKIKVLHYFLTLVGKNDNNNSLSFFLSFLLCIFVLHCKWGGKRWYQCYKQYILTLRLKSLIYDHFFCFSKKQSKTNVFIFFYSNLYKLLFYNRNENK